MMRKKVNYTTCTPIPSYVPRQLAVELLHSHGEIITVSPLVIGYKAIKAPPNAPADEYYSSWYEVEERVQFIPGVGKLGAGKIKFNGCFHDLPWGLQTHVYAPAGVETRNKYRIGGNQPGEPREPVEMGIGAPPEGLYLREDVEIKCNITMASFVKKEQKAASKVLIERMLKKAELLEEGTLQAMFENGRIKTLNPNDRTSTLPGHMPPGAPSSPRPQSMMMSSSGSFRQSHYDSGHMSMPAGGYSPGGAKFGGSVSYNQGGFYPTNSHSSNSSPNQHHSQAFAMELPGDMPPMPAQPPQTSMDQKLAPPPSHMHPANRYSTISELSSEPRPDPNRRWSELDSSPRLSDQGSDSRPTSYAPTVSDGPMRSPRMEQTSFSSVPEENENHQYHHPDSLKRLSGGQAPQQPPLPPYNPADYAKV